MRLLSNTELEKKNVKQVSQPSLPPGFDFRAKLNLYLIAEWDNFGFSLEQVKTASAFVELDEEENSPSAWNVEAAWYPSRTTEFALRYEQAKELADEAEQQAGIQFTWRPANRISFSVEYIRQKFKRDFVFDDNDREFKDGDIIAGSFSYIF